MGVIGLTGGIGSGKTLISDTLCSLGAEIIDADVITKELYLPGSELLQAIADTFGKEFILADGNLDRRKLRKNVFADEKKIKKLNILVHPAIRKNITNQLFSSQKEHQVLVVPLLLETGYNDLCDEIWVVSVKEKCQFERVMLRDNVSEEEALKVIRSQMPLAEKLKFADRVIDNNGSVKATVKQTKKAFKKFKEINY